MKTSLYNYNSNNSMINKSFVVEAAKIDQILKQKNLPSDITSRIKELYNRLTNPSKYTNYLIKYYNEPDIVELINTFEKRYKRLETKDINQYTIQDLRKTLQLAKDVPSKTEIKETGADLIQETDTIKLYKIHDAEASCLYGSGTKWCISGRTNNLFDEHNKEYAIYFAISKNRKQTDPLYKVAFVVAADGKIITYNAQDKEIKTDIIIQELNIDKSLLKPKTTEDYIKAYNLIKNDDGTYNSTGDIGATPFIKDGKFIIQFKEVNGYFNCYNNQLTTLEGCPQKVGGNFDCQTNQLTTLEGSPQKVGGGFYCSYNQLTTLEGSPQTIGGNFYCADNQLTTLEGSPQTVGGHFYCSHNQLTTLEGSPQKVGGDFYCSLNQLTTLEGSTQTVGGDFYCSDNPVSEEGLYKTVDRDYLK